MSNVNSFNRAVPEPDLRSALSAIDNVIAKKQKDVKQTIAQKYNWDRRKMRDYNVHDQYSNTLKENSSPNKNGYNKNNHYKTTVDDYNSKALHNALGQLHQSLTHNINRFAIPVSEKDYRQILRQDEYHPAKQQPRKSRQPVVSNSNRTNHDLLPPAPPVPTLHKGHSYLDRLDQDLDSESEGPDLDDLTFSSSDSESDDEDEEELLIDKEAQARVIQLREEVRVEAKKLYELQTTVPQLATDIAEREMKLFRQELDTALTTSSSSTTKEQPNQKEEGDAKQITSVDDDEIELGWLHSDFIDWNEHEDDNQNHDDYKLYDYEGVKQMQHSFKRLTLTLTSVEKTLPDQLDGLQETINTIEESIDQKLRTKHDTKYMSAVERAIVSNECMRTHNAAATNAIKHEDVSNSIPCPEQRFAMFVAK